MQRTSCTQGLPILSQDARKRFHRLLRMRVCKGLPEGDMIRDAFNWIVDWIGNSKQSKSKSQSQSSRTKQRERNQNCVAPGRYFFNFFQPHDNSGYCASCQCLRHWSVLLCNKIENIVCVFAPLSEACSNR